MILPGFGFDMLLVREVAKSPDEGREFISNILTIKLSMGIFASFLLISFVALKQYDYQVIQIILLLLVSFIMMSILSSFYSIFRAYERMEFEAILLFLNSLLRVVFGLIAIKLGMKLNGIIFGLVLADLLSVLLAGIVCRRFTSLRLKINPHVTKQIFVSAIPFGVLSLINVVWFNTDNLMIAKLVNEDAVGWYAAADRILVFVFVIPHMFMVAIFPVLSRLSISDKNALQHTYTKSFSYMLMMAFPVAIGGYLISEQIILFIYGEQFLNTILIFQVMVWVVLFSFVGYVNGATLNATGKERLFATTYTAFTLANIILDYVFIKQFGYIGACYATLVLTCIGFFLYSTICHYQLKVKPEWYIIVKSLLASVLMGGIVFALKGVLANIFVVIPIGVLTYFALIWLLRALPKEDATALLNLVKRRSGIKNISRYLL